jgi:coiled-coil domain-containing protein 130
MAERKATNKYYPPDYDPSKGSLNRQMGRTVQAPTVRIELPFHAICAGCSRPLAQGLRFNAVKSSAGTFQDSVPIWQFKFACPDCKTPIIMQTDPENSDYKLTSGATIAAKSELQRSEVRQSSSLIQANDPMARLEKRKSDEEKRASFQPYFERLQQEVAAKHGEEFETNRALRNEFRSRKLCSDSDYCAAETAVNSQSRKRVAPQPEPVSTLRMDDKTQSILAKARKMGIGHRLTSVRK